MGLTALAIKAAKGREKQYKLADSGGRYSWVMAQPLRFRSFHNRIVVL